MRGPALLLLVLVPAACDRVFGLERDPAGADAGRDAPSQTVTGTFTYRYATNDPAGVPIEVEQPHPDVALNVYLGDDVEGSALPLDASGAFAFARQGASHYRLRWVSALDGNVTTEWDTDATSLQLASLSAGRPSRAPVTQPTVLTFTPPIANGTRVVLSTGIWTETAIAGDTLDWKAAYAASPPLGLLDVSQHDRLYYVVRQSFADAITGGAYTAFGSEASAQVTMVDGMARPVSLAFAPSTRDQCARIVALRAAMMARVGVAAEAGTTAIGDDWIIQATPGTTIGPVGGLTVAYNSEVTATNQTINVSYRNPFPGHHPIAEMGGFNGRSIQAPGGAPLLLPIGVRVYTPVEPCPATTVLDASMGIPGVMFLDGTVLTAPDGTMVNLPANQPHLLSWNLGVDGRVDSTTATLYEVAADAGKTVITAQRAYKTIGKSVELDPAVLSQQRLYIVRLDANIGVANAAAGDMRTVTYPYGNATQWSHVFQVELQ